SKRATPIQEKFRRKPHSSFSNSRSGNDPTNSSMTRITNADHVLLLLRDHLERTQKTRRKRPSATTESKARPTALERASQLAASGALSDEDIERTIVAGLLAEALGDGVANDA